MATEVLRVFRILENQGLNFKGVLLLRLAILTIVMGMGHFISKINYSVMASRVFFVSIILNISMIGCNEVVDNTHIEDTAIQSTKPSIPKRPNEIEVIDLTEDVALFIVVAGAYSTRASAQKKADSLKKVGFTNAAVIQRPGSKLFSALVERFDSETAAIAFTKELETNNEIKSYVYELEE